MKKKKELVKMSNPGGFSILHSPGSAYNTEFDNFFFYNADFKKQKS